MAAAPPAAVTLFPASFSALAEQAALLERTARWHLEHSSTDYLTWYREILGSARLDTQAVILPAILPPRGSWTLRENSLFDPYFSLGLQRWLNESGDESIQQTWTLWMSTATPVIQALLRTSAGWPEFVYKIIQSFKIHVTHTQDSFVWLFKTVILTALEDGLDVNWRAVFYNTAPANYFTADTGDTLASLLYKDPTTALPPAEVLIEQANELLSRLPDSEQEYAEWWRDVTKFLPAEAQAALLPQLLPKPGQWRAGIMDWLLEPYFENAVSPWLLTEPKWLENARPVVEAVFRAAAIAPGNEVSQTKLVMSLVSAFNGTIRRYKAWTKFADEYAMLFDVVAKVVSREGRSVDWQRIVDRLPDAFTLARVRGETFPTLDAVLDPLLYTPEQLLERAWLQRRQIELAANLALAPDIPPPEEAQLLLIALTETPSPQIWEQLSDAYKQLIRDAFRSAEIETQNDVLQYLPSLDALGTSKDIGLLLIAAQMTQQYTSMITALIFDEGRASQTIEENVAAVIQHGDQLLNYMILEYMHSGPNAFFESTLAASARGLARNMMSTFVAVWWDPNHSFKGRPITFAVFDPIILWLVARSTQLAVELNLPPPDSIEIRDILLKYHLPPLQRIPIYPTFLPLTVAFLQPRIAAAEAAQRALDTARAAMGLRQRLTARRRLSSAVPYFFEPAVPVGLAAALATAHPLEAKEELTGLTVGPLPSPLFVSAPTRRSSTLVSAIPADLPPSAIRAFLAEQSQQQEAELVRQRVGRRASHTITPASSSADIRSWLAQQQAQEAAFAATLPLIPAATRARWQQGRRTSLASVLAAEPLRLEESTENEEKRIYQAKKAAGVAILNCEKYAHETCSESHNQGGVHWCKIPAQFRWGPILPNRQCYDVREIFREFARQVTDIPSIPYKARPLTYPDRVPVRPNHLQTLLTIAQENKLQIPTEVYLYLAGRELQRAPPKYMSENVRTAARLQDRAAYAAVPLFLEAQEEAISKELAQSIYSGPSAIEAANEEQEEEEEGEEEED